jgi:two-component system LytT family sensor kinase
MNTPGKIFLRYKLDHVLFWIITIAFHIYNRRYLIEKAGLDQFILEILFRNGLLAIIIYINILVLMPKFFQTKKYGRFLLMILLLLLFYTGVKDLHDAYLDARIVFSETHDFFKYTYYSKFSYYNFSIAVFYVGFTMALELSKDWFIQREHLQKIKIENLNTEINYLKAQINPHFLFNSLNTLYVQIDQKNSEARKTLEKISEMLRYQLYECNNDTISMEKELEYISSYIELQKLRKENNFDITCCYDEGIKVFRVAPLLFIPFIENAFKHLSNFTDRTNIVRVEMKKQDGKMLCTVFNTCCTSSKNNQNGIGLRNVKRRLELLYPDKHELSVEQEPASYKITLTLQLL